jgi:integrase
MGDLEVSRDLHIARHVNEDGKADACFDITYKDPTGRKIWEKVGWKSEGYTAQMANLLRADRMQSLRHGDSIKKKAEDNELDAGPRVMTFGEAWKLYSEKWLPNLAKPKDEHYRYNAHIAPRFEDRPLEAITPLDLETFKLDLLAKNLAPATVKHILSAMGRIYNKMAEWELYMGRIPTASIKMPKVDNARVRYLTPDEADRLLSALKARSISWWRIANVSLHTGMRSGEVSALTWGDLNMEDNTIHVRFGKTGSRMAHMNNAVKCIFQEMHQGQPSDLIFPATGGGMRLHTDVSNTFSRVVEDLKMNENVADRRHKVVFHTLRQSMQKFWS